MGCEVLISKEESDLIQKAAEGVALVLSFDPEKVDEESRKKAMDLYGAVLIEDLLKKKGFVAKVEAALAKILEEKMG